MLRRNTEKKIIIEADDLASRKENLDVLSWRRIIEIAKHIQGRVLDEEVQDLTRELISIAQANTTLSKKLNISTSESFVDLPAVEHTSAKPRSVVRDVEQDAHPGFSAAGMPLFDKQSYIDEGAQSTGFTETRSTEGASHIPSPRPSSCNPLPPHIPSPSSSTPSSYGDDEESSQGLKYVSKNEVLEKQIAAEEQDTAEEHGAAEERIILEDTRPAQDDENLEDLRSAREDKSLEDTKQSQEGETPYTPSAEMPYSKEELANFSLIYTSRDGSLSMFQDKEGHLVSVDTSKLFS